jgi:hypothetical protein
MAEKRDNRHSDSYILDQNSCDSGNDGDSNISFVRMSPPDPPWMDIYSLLRFQSRMDAVTMTASSNANPHTGSIFVVRDEENEEVFHFFTIFLMQTSLSAGDILISRSYIWDDIQRLD